jgi:O-antigen/teichoic acid export membrane protein
MMRSLTRESVSGFAWLLAQSGGARVVGFLSQILLARLLLPADFGEVALVSSVVAVVATLVGFGVDDVVLSRSRRFRMWLAPAFWVSLSFSVLGASTLLAVAPLAARLYRSPAIFGLLAILTVSLPLSALATVPNACLRSNLRFRFIATYATVELLATQLLTILLAWRGFGAFSFVIPTPLSALVRTIVFWRVARPNAKWRLRWWQLRILLHSGVSVFGQKLVTSLRENGDYLLLGALATKSEVGLYFMAFKLAAAPVYTLVNSMYGVLFPALAQLRPEPLRQRAAALSASRSIALAVIPLSFLQAAVSPSLLHLFFGEKWTAAAAMLSVLSVGLAFDVIPCVAGALLTANGKFAAQWRWSIATIPFFFLFIATGCRVGGAMGVAIAVAAFFILGAPGYSYFALRQFGCSLRDVAGIYLPPTVCSVGAVGFGLLMARLPHVYGREVAMIAVVCAFSAASYALAMRWLSPAATRDAIHKLSLLLDRSA